MVFAVVILDILEKLAVAFVLVLPHVLHLVFAIMEYVYVFLVNGVAPVRTHVQEVHLVVVLEVVLLTVLAFVIRDIQV